MKATGYNPHAGYDASSAVCGDYYETSAMKTNVADLLKYGDWILQD